LGTPSVYRPQGGVQSAQRNRLVIYFHFSVGYELGVGADKLGAFSEAFEQADGSVARL